MVRRAAPAVIAHRQEAMMGQREAVDRAAQVREHLVWPGARALGVDHPRLAIELVEPMGDASGGATPGRRRRKAQGLFVVRLV
jgi:hypothetical protein